MTDLTVNLELKTPGELLDEIMLLQEAKRRALKVADERAKENVELRAAFLRFVQQDNACQAYDTGQPCHSHKCGCALEMQSYIDAVRANRGDA